MISKLKKNLPEKVISWKPSEVIVFFEIVALIVKLTGLMMSNREVLMNDEKINGMEFKSINPFNSECVKVYTSLTDSELDAKLDKSKSAFASWKKTPLSERTSLMVNAGKILKNTRK